MYVVGRTRKQRLVAVAALAALMLTACGGARGGGAASGSGGGEGDQQTFTIKFSHVVTPNTPKGQAAEKFKEVVDRECGDRVNVDIFPNSELFGDKDELQALQTGSVQMLAPASAKFTTIAPQLQVLDLPFLFDSVEEIPEVASPDTAAGKAIFENEALASKNIKVLNLWDNGLKQLSSNKQMTSPADLQGLKFRIQPSDVLRSQFAAWGAGSTPLAFAEVYNALQQGVVDGQENPYSNIESQNMHTVQDFITESNHGYIGYVLVINQEFYDSLPSELQECVDTASQESSDFNREIAADINQEAKQTIVDAGTTTITTLTDEQRQAFKDAVVPKVWQEHAGVIGQDLIDALLEEQKQ
jgi:C4-dicarboxylate-binding protein DctP